jgi:hypothetical protein
VYLRVDVGQVPPVVELRDHEDFTTFKVCVQAPPHAWVEPAALTQVAGRTGDAAWQRKLADMVSYAQTRGWLDDHGRVRAHLEISQIAEGREE